MVNSFIQITQQMLLQDKQLPFYLYSANSEQHLKNIEFIKPLFIFIVNGYKEIRSEETITCHSGEFIFFADHKLTTVRNIPQQNGYMAFILEFEYHDFIDLPAAEINGIAYTRGYVGVELQNALEQLVIISAWAPEHILAHRRREILLLLNYLGYKNIAALGQQSSLSSKIHHMFMQNRFQNLTVQQICQALFMSESTLRRKLRDENQSISAIKRNAQLGYGLHLLQTTKKSIQHIVELCGYQTHSRFTKNFKQRFGLTPRELRKTKNIF